MLYQKVSCEMKGKMKIILALLLVKTNVQRLSSASQNCDLENKLFQEGNIGAPGNFKWLGILRVHKHEKTSRLFKVALTGLVLVKDKYAIANAADIVSIPRHLFREDSEAYFITENGQSWSCRPKSYVAHPEYEYSTYVTVALIELDIGKESDSPLIPICWPNYSFNTSTHLYALGYTDENKFLEKIIYKLQYVNRSLCDEFYNRAELKPDKHTVPVFYQCGYAPNNKVHCVWENGMVFASNSSGQWTLIGFGLRGPGCAGPARFIDMYHYLPWIESSTEMDQVPNYY